MDMQKFTLYRHGKELVAVSDKGKESIAPKAMTVADFKRKICVAHGTAAFSDIVELSSLDQTGLARLYYDGYGKRLGDMAEEAMQQADMPCLAALEAMRVWRKIRHHYGKHLNCFTAALLLANLMGAEPLRYLELMYDGDHVLLRVSKVNKRRHGLEDRYLFDTNTGLPYEGDAGKFLPLQDYGIEPIFSLADAGLDAAQGFKAEMPFTEL